MPISKSRATGAFLSLEEAATYLSVNPRTLRRRISDGSLAAYRLAGTRGIRIKRTDLDAAIQQVPSASVYGGAS